MPYYPKYRKYKERYLRLQGGNGVLENITLKHYYHGIDSPGGLPGADDDEEPPRQPVDTLMAIITSGGLSSTLFRSYQQEGEPPEKTIAAIEECGVIMGGVDSTPVSQLCPMYGQNGVVFRDPDPEMVASGAIHFVPLDKHVAYVVQDEKKKEELVEKLDKEIFHIDK